VRGIATSCFSCFANKIDVSFNSPIRIVNSAFNKAKGLMDGLQLAAEGGIFENRGTRLPPQPWGYYKRLDGVGGFRIVVGAGGQVYISSDHYKTFTCIIC
jgi:ribonuclease